MILHKDPHNLPFYGIIVCCNLCSYCNCNPQPITTTTTTCIISHSSLQIITNKKKVQIYMIGVTTGKISNKESSLSSHIGLSSYLNDGITMYHRWFYKNNNNEFRNRFALKFDTGSVILRR